MGIAGIRVQIFNLAGNGKIVLDEEGYGNALTIYGLSDRSGNTLTNCVYLYHHRPRLRSRVIGGRARGDRWPSPTIAVKC